MIKYVFKDKNYKLELVQHDIFYLNLEASF
jgi:hypothetical protein